MKLFKSTNAYVFFFLFISDFKEQFYVKYIYDYNFRPITYRNKFVYKLTKKKASESKAVNLISRYKKKETEEK